jgi:hypothetical protein
VAEVKIKGTLMFSHTQGSQSHSQIDHVEVEGGSTSWKSEEREQMAREKHAQRRQTFGLPGILTLSHPHSSYKEFSFASGSECFCLCIKQEMSLFPESGDGRFSHLHS